MTNCIASAGECVVSAPFLTVFVLRTLRLFEISEDILQVTVSNKYNNTHRELP